MADKKNYTDKEFVEKYNQLVQDTTGSLFMYPIFAIVSIVLGCFLYPIMLDYNVNYRYLAVLLSFVLFFILLFIDAIVKGSIQNTEFEKEIGMNYSNAEKCCKFIISNPMSIDYLPLVQQVCRLNPGAKSSQKEQIKGWYGIDNDMAIWKVFECGLYDQKSAYLSLCNESLTLRQVFIEKLFKLAVVDDGYPQ